MERTTILPPGIALPLTENNSHSHNALIVITSSISLFLALASLAIRIYATRRRGVILKDDYVLALVVIFACAQISVTLQQVHYGWGKSEDSISSTNYDQMAKIGLVVDILYILVIGLSKICTVMFYRNLSLQTNTLLSNMILGSCGVWIVLGMTLLGVRCSGGSSQDINDRCPGLYPRWQAISAIDIVLETVILAYPVKIIYNVQIPVLKKLKIMCILSCRAVLIPLCAIHLAYINTQLTSPDPPLDGAYATTVAELHLGLSVILLTISSLKIFVAVYEDDQGLAYTEDASKSHSQSGRLRTWRSSCPCKDPMLSTVGCDEEPILLAALGPCSSCQRSDSPSGGGEASGIIRSVQISVTRESVC